MDQRSNSIVGSEQRRNTFSIDSGSMAGEKLWKYNPAKVQYY